MDSWIFDGEQSVRWLVEHPTPIYLCVVDKTGGRVRVYHTSQRFYVWGRGKSLAHVALLPTTDQEGNLPKWPENSEEFALGAPILDFSIAEFLQPSFASSARQTLETWIKIDEGNLASLRNGIRRFVVPVKYTPNHPPDTRVSATFMPYTRPATDDELDQALPAFRESLENIGMELFKRDDLRGAALCALLHRHVFRGNLYPFMRELHNRIAGTPDQFGNVGVPQLEKLIDDALSAAQVATRPDF